jgi:hypothetical protein
MPPQGLSQTPHVLVRGTSAKIVLAPVEISPATHRSSCSRDTFSSAVFRPKGNHHANQEKEHLEIQQESKQEQNRHGLHKKGCPGR